jgi:hypothetical protein
MSTIKINPKNLKGGNGLGDLGTGARKMLKYIFKNGQ